MKDIPIGKRQILLDHANNIVNALQRDIYKKEDEYDIPFPKTMENVNLAKAVDELIEILSHKRKYSDLNCLLISYGYYEWARQQEN